MSSDADPNSAADAGMQADSAATPSDASSSSASSPSAASRLASRGGIAALVVGLGVLAGLGTFTFGYGKGASYLSNNPAGCANCHVMHDHFDAWQHSSHHHVAVCNDCHLPHNFVEWATKAEDGFMHSLKFTLENYHEPIRIRPHNSRITQNTCIHCHQDFVHALLPPPAGDGEASKASQETISCVHCHKNVGHAYRSP
jgi:cytochrome c nitrite reductase small subunit